MALQDMYQALLTCVTISYHILVGTMKPKDYLRVLGVDGRITLKWIVQECGLSRWAAWKYLRVKSSDGLL
jgi:hypothetical protein